MQQQRYYNNPYRPPQRRSFVQRALPWLLITAVAALLIVLGIRALRDNQVAQEIAPYENVFAENIHIDGISLSGMTPQEAYEAVYGSRRQNISGWSMGLTYNGHTYITVDYQTLGLSVNEESINQALKEAWDLTHTGDNYQRKEAIDRLKAEPHQASTVQNSEFVSQKLEQYLNEIANYMGSISQPADAVFIRFDPSLPDPFVFQKEQIGYALDVEKAKQQILDNAAQGISGDFELKPEAIHPAVTEAMLRKNMQLRSVAQTRISSSSEPNRTENIRISAAKISGTVLRPRAEFSFNATAQERTRKNGYLEALEMVYGYYETGIGGGVCQTSSTMYQAALLSGLEITSRRPHGEPVGYTDPGLDATVYWTKDRVRDFKFRNNTNHDLYIIVRVKPGTSSRNLVTEVLIYGEPLEESVQYKLKTIKSETLLPPSPKYEADKNGEHVYYRDEEKVKSEAKEGSVIDTYLQKYVNAQLVDEKLVGTSTYPARGQVIWRGIHNR